MNGRRHVRLLLLVTFSLLTMFSAMGIASANVPTVVQIDNISLGSSGRIRLQISHLNPSPSHYVDMVEVDVNGQVTQFNLQPQDSNPFTVELDLGQLQGTPNVKARAHCNLHGWGSWSNQIQVPEFTGAGATIVVALIGSLLIARRVTKKYSVHLRCHQSEVIQTTHLSTNSDAQMLQSKPTAQQLYANSSATSGDCDALRFFFFLFSDFK